MRMNRHFWVLLTVSICWSFHCRCVGKSRSSEKTPEKHSFKVVVDNTSSATSSQPICGVLAMRVAAQSLGSQVALEFSGVASGAVALMFSLFCIAQMKVFLGGQNISCGCFGNQSMNVGATTILLAIFLSFSAAIICLYDLRRENVHDM